MTKQELETLLSQLESIHTDTARSILRLRDLLEYWDDITPSAQTRITTETQQSIGEAQRALDQVTDFRVRT